MVAGQVKICVIVHSDAIDAEHESHCISPASASESSTRLSIRHWCDMDSTRSEDNVRVSRASRTRRKHPAERTNAHCSACFVQSDGHGALNSVKKYASHVVPSQARFESKRIERVFLFLPQLFRLIGECGPDIVVKLPENPHLLLARGTQGTLATQRRNRALDVVFVVGIVNMAFQGLQPVRHLHIAFAVLQEIHLLSVPSLSWNRSVV
ncbi:hypothetical protein KC365_g84 [Hortaea werneckii]|nr:hypothetical protein KC365_g84 [Hortaea werneckii]